MRISSLILLAGSWLAVSPAVNAEDTKVTMAKIDIRNITKAIEVYKLKKGQWPTTLKDLIDTGYLEPRATLLDPWGNPYKYDPKGKRNKEVKPDVWAIAPNKVEIGNWPVEQK